MPSLYMVYIYVVKVIKVINGTPEIAELDDIITVSV